MYKSLASKRFPLKITTLYLSLKIFNIFTRYFSMDFSYGSYQVSTSNSPTEDLVGIRPSISSGIPLRIVHGIPSCMLLKILPGFLPQFSQVFVHRFRTVFLHKCFLESEIFLEILPLGILLGISSGIFLGTPSEIPLGVPSLALPGFPAGISPGFYQ